MTDTEKLLEKIKSKGIKLGAIVKALNTSYGWLHKKIYGEQPFTNEEIVIIARILNMSDSEIINIFFGDNVDKMPTS